MLSKIFLAPGPGKEAALVINRLKVNFIGSGKFGLKKDHNESDGFPSWIHNHGKR